MATVIIDKGKVSAKSNITQEPRSLDEVRRIIDMRREWYEDIGLNDCRDLVLHMREASVVWQKLGYTSFEDMVRNGYGLDFREAELAYNWLKIRNPQTPISLPEVIARITYENNGGLRDKPGNPTGINQHTGRNYYNCNNSCDESVSQGNSDDYLRARLKRDDPKRYDMLLTGQYRSTRAAAIDAGIIDPEKTKRYQLPTDPTKAGKYLAERVDAEWMLACYDAFMKASE